MPRWNDAGSLTPFTEAPYFRLFRPLKQSIIGAQGARHEGQWLVRISRDGGCSPPRRVGAPRCCCSAGTLPECLRHRRARSLASTSIVMRARSHRLSYIQPASLAQDECQCQVNEAASLASLRIATIDGLERRPRHEGLHRVQSLKVRPPPKMPSSMELPRSVGCSSPTARLRRRSRPATRAHIGAGRAPTSHHHPRPRAPHPRARVSRCPG